MPGKRTWIGHALRRRVAWVLPLIVLALLAALAFEWQYAVRHVYIVPVWELALLDESFVRDAARGEAPPLWRVAFGYVINGHWPFLPFWAFWADFSMDEARGRLPIALSWLSLFALALLVGRHLRPAARCGGFAAGLLVAVALFWPAHMESMISPLQLVTSFSLLFGAAALAVAVAYPDWRGTAASWLLVGASTASFGYGPALWPVLVALHLLGRRWGSAAATGLVGAAAIVAYKIAASGNMSYPLRLLARDPSTFVSYLLAQIGASAPYLLLRTEPLIAQVAGVLLLLALLALLPMLRARGGQSAADVELRANRFLLALAAWLIGSMMLTALARHNLGPAQAISTRYLVPSTLLLAVVLMLAWRRAVTAPRLRVAVTVIAALAVVALLAGTPRHAERLVAIRANQQAAVLAQTFGLRETDEAGVPETQLNLWPLPLLFDHLRAQRMGYYRAEPFGWVGRPLDEIGRLDADLACAYSLDRHEAYAGGERLMGWIYAPTRDAAPEHVLLARDGRVVGLSLLFERRDVAALHGRNALWSGYRAYLSTPEPGVVTLLGRFADGSLCRAGDIAVPTSTRG